MTIQAGKTMRRSRWGIFYRCAFGFACALVLSALTTEALAGERLLVLAAASLKDALDDADAAYARQGGSAVDASYAASGTLAKQLENGAPAAVFISADLEWMDYAAAKKLIKPETRINLLGNTLVLVAPADSQLQVTLAAGTHLAPLLGDGRLAIGDPQSVPAGKYAEAALEKLGIWLEVENKLARTENVRAALAFVSRHETPLGIVYGTDAAADTGVKVIGTFPEGSYPPIIYPVAETATNANPEAAKYLAWLKSAAAEPFFRKQGFAMLR